MKHSTFNDRYKLFGFLLITILSTSFKVNAQSIKEKYPIYSSADTEIEYALESLYGYKGTTEIKNVYTGKKKGQYNYGIYGINFTYNKTVNQKELEALISKIEKDYGIDLKVQMRTETDQKYKGSKKNIEYELSYINNQLVFSYEDFDYYSKYRKKALKDNIKDFRKKKLEGKVVITKDDSL